MTLARATAPDTRLRGPWLMTARVGWVALTVQIVGLNAAMLPRYLAVLQAPCQPGAPCYAIQLTAYDQQFLRQTGLTLGSLVGYRLAVNLVAVVVFCALGTLLFWRRSADRMALFGAYMLVLFGGVAFTDILQATLAQASAPGRALVTALDVLGQSAFLIFFLLFPSGRFVPHWTRWLAVANVVYWTYVALFTGFFDNQAGGANVVFVALLLSVVGAQIYRYLRVSSPRERQQTKWVVFGFAIAVVGFLLIITIGNAIVSPVAHHSQVLQTLVAQTGIYGSLLLIPITITIAILRSGLFAIDVIIRRTLIYGTLTTLLAAVYFACVIAAQALAQALTGIASLPPVAIVASTLLIAALFNPLRRAIQRFIDRRFYRRKYNTAKTLAAFSATLRNEVDLNQLRDDLLDVVRKTMQPAHVSLWLREPQPPRRHA
jgi:hypothetical protein